MKPTKLIMPFLLVITILSHEAFSYETNVHSRISENAFNVSMLGSGYLKNLGISATDTFDKLTPLQLIQKGSVREDDDLAMRWLNHYYDPMTGRGLNPCVSTLCKPSLQWGKDATENAWSWKWARDSYYKALTDANPNYRNIYFSYVFRSLGQVIHLVQDKAVPAHVRNDPHGAPIIKYDLYEAFTRDNAGLLTYTGYPAVDIKTFNGFDKFWINNGVGLSEYTNRNFFSRDTIFKNYPHPAKENTNAALVEQTARDGKTDKVWYIQGYTSERLAAYSYLNRWLLSDKWEYNLDDYVHKDYAGQLIPRAVGYSAGLLDYFFRGEMDMIKDPNNSSQYIIKNLSNENMFGTFSLYYDDISDNRHLIITMENLSINANSQSDSVTFTPPADAKEPCKYILVFQGQMGQEQGAVVGKVVGLDCGTLTIDGSETITRNSNSQYTANGCCGAVEWSVSGKGATISSTGLLTAGATACGTLTITATCSGCGTSATQDVRVVDAGWWVLDETITYCEAWSQFNCEYINGDELIASYYYPGGFTPCAPFYGNCQLVTTATCYSPNYCLYLSRDLIYHWKCP